MKYRLLKFLILHPKFNPLVNKIIKFNMFYNKVKYILNLYIISMFCMKNDDLVDMLITEWENYEKNN